MAVAAGRLIMIDVFFWQGFLMVIFHWQNNIVYVEANREINRVANPRDINYYSVLFKPPIELEQQKSLFLGGLKEALKAYGTAGAFSGVESNVIFNW